MLWSDRHRRDAERAATEEQARALRELHRVWPLLVAAAMVALFVILV